LKRGAAIGQSAHCGYPALHKDHIRREVGKAFADGVEHPDIKIPLLLGGEKTVNKALRQAPEIQVVLLANRPHKNSARTTREDDRPHRAKRQDDRHAGAVESQATSRVAAPMKGRQ
jgi:hypothetical protein